MNATRVLEDFKARHENEFQWHKPRITKHRDGYMVMPYTTGKPLRLIYLDHDGNFVKTTRPPY